MWSTTNFCTLCLIWVDMELLIILSVNRTEPKTSSSSNKILLDDSQSFEYIYFLTTEEKFKCKSSNCHEMSWPWSLQSRLCHFGLWYMTYGLMGVYHLVFRKVPSSSYQNLPTFMMNFKGKLPSIFINFWQIFSLTHPCLRKISGEMDPCLESLGSKPT